MFSRDKEEISFSWEWTQYKTPSYQGFFPQQDGEQQFDVTESPHRPTFSILTSAGEYSYHLLQRYISFQYSGVFIHSSIKTRYQLSSVVSQG